MHSRALRILLVVACVCGIAAAAVFIRSLENVSTARRAALRDFDRLAREADRRPRRGARRAAGLPGLSARSTGFWMSKVDADHAER